MVNEPTQQPLEGRSAEETLRQAVERAVDYRGDVTLRLKNGQTLEGYVYDRRMECPQPCLRMLPADGGPRLTIALADLAGIDLTGRDMAAGKSWEAWLKGHQESKERGAAAERQAESLDK